MIEEAEERHGRDLRDELQRARVEMETTFASLHAMDARLESLEAKRPRFVHLETVCSSLEQQSRDIPMASFTCPTQWGPSIFSRRVGVCTVVDQQQPRDIPMAFSTCPMQWGPSQKFCRIGVCTVVDQQQPRDIPMAV